MWESYDCSYPQVELTRPEITLKGLVLDEETLRHNQACIKKQLAKFLDFESDVPNRAELVNNYDWMKDFSFLDFARKVGKHITVNYMMAKDSVKRRLNGEARDGLSFTEFTYQLLQGYDFLHLYETKGCKLQMGGSDQWGNITTGAELIRRTNGGEMWKMNLYDKLRKKRKCCIISHYEYDNFIA